MSLENLPTGNYGQSKVNSVRNNEVGSGPAGRVLPRQLSTGSTRGTQTVGYGNVKIDGSNDRIQLSSNSTTITIGDTSDTDNVTGIGLTDSTTGKKLISLGRETSTIANASGLVAYDTDETRRLLAGTYPGGSVKIKLSQIGHDVVTATDDQLIWSSDFNMFKIAKTGVATVPAIAAAADSSNFTTSSVVVSTGISSNSPLAFTVYANNGPNTYGVIPLTITYGDAAEGARIAATWFASSFVQNNELKLNLAGNNFVNVIQDARDFRWYVYKETASAT